MNSVIEVVVVLATMLISNSFAAHIQPDSALNLVKPSVITEQMSDVAIEQRETDDLIQQLTFHGTCLNFNWRFFQRKDIEFKFIIFNI